MDEGCENEKAELGLLRQRAEGLQTEITKVATERLETFTEQAERLRQQVEFDKTSVEEVVVERDRRDRDANLNLLRYQQSCNVFDFRSAEQSLDAAGRGKRECARLSRQIGRCGGKTRPLRKSAMSLAQETHILCEYAADLLNEAQSLYARSDELSKRVRSIGRDICALRQLAKNES